MRNRQLKRLFCLIFIASFLTGFAGCAKDVVTGKTTLNYYSLESEPKLGKQVLDQQIKALKFNKKNVDSERNRAELERLQTIVKRIGAVSHYPQFPYEVHLADIDVVNAWCAPGGKIMVFEGLWDPKKGLVEKGNEDQLAAVLAHEIAHANARHVTETLSTNITIMMVGAAVSTAIAAGGYQEGSNLFGEVFSQGMNIFVPSYSRKNEYEADAIGLIYMAKAGYDPREAVKLWETAAKKKKDYASIYASHPSSGARAKRLKELLPKAVEIYESSKKKEDT
jgi:predicted Zn-dependent protease